MDGLGREERVVPLCRVPPPRPGGKCARVPWPGSCFVHFLPSPPCPSISLSGLNPRLLRGPGGLDRKVWAGAIAPGGEAVWCLTCFLSQPGHRALQTPLPSSGRRSVLAWSSRALLGGLRSGLHPPLLLMAASKPAGEPPLAKPRGVYSLCSLPLGSTQHLKSIPTKCPEGAESEPEVSLW